MNTNKKIKAVWLDPLSFQELRAGDLITLEASQGNICGFHVSCIQADDALLLKTSESKKVVASNSIVSYSEKTIGSVKLRVNDRVTVIGPRGQKIPMKIGMLLGKDVIVLVAPFKRKKINFLDKMRLFKHL